MSFPIPCDAERGNHTITVKLVDSATQAIQLSKEITFRVERSTNLVSSCAGITLTSISPSTAPAGTSLVVVLTGSNFGSNPTIDTGAKPNIIKVSYFSKTDSQITAGFTIDADAIDGSYNIRVCDGKTCSDPLPFLILVPHHLKVVADDTGVVSTCPNVVARRITFRVVNQIGNIVGKVPVKENFLSVSQNTCNNGQPLPATCRVTDNDLGDFTDFITTNNCNSGSVGCGYDITDLWEWCPPKHKPVGLGKLIETVHSDKITVNGVTTPNKIAVGTDIFP
jgi:hypothetical protein